MKLIKSTFMSIVTILQAYISNQVLTNVWHNTDGI